MLAHAFILSLVAAASAAALQAPPTVVRPAAQAGSFYPEAPAALKAAIEGYVRDAVPARVQDPRVLVVPHAGIVYSGQIAADAFAQTRGMTIETVVLLGANHTASSFGKASVYDGDGWATPLGTVRVDRALAEAIVAANVGAVFDRTLHEREHSIEVQIPFLQVLHPRAAIVPIVIGSPDPALCERLGKSIARLTQGRRVLIVASSDLSHYPAENDARRLDVGTLEAIVSGAPASLLVRNEQEVRSAELPVATGLVTRACGLGPLLVATEAARALGASRGVVLSYANSGDTVFGTADRVVGYGAVAFGVGTGGGDSSALALVRPEGETPLDATDKRVLLRLARETLARQFESETVPLPRGGGARLQRTNGAFVTLKVRGNGALRGCVGRIVGEGPLIRLVSTMSLAAAFADRRFTPLTKRELSGVEIEISVLTIPRPIRAATDIVVGRDGVVLQVGDKSAVFLPYVAEEQGWSRDELLDNLAVKAGLDRTAWRDRRAKFLVFQADTFSEATSR